MNNMLVKVDENSLAVEMLSTLDRNEVIKQEDKDFLQAKKVSLQKTLVKTHMWRTRWQHDSILSDRFFPTIHAKFHQAMLEQKVHFGESIRLAKEYALKEIEYEEKLLDKEDAAENISDERRLELVERKLDIEMAEIKNQLMEMRVAMDYRMKEVKSWEDIKTGLINVMKNEGLTEEQIYNKEYGEFDGYFYLFLNNFKSIDASTDSGEVNNLVGLAKWAVTKAKQMRVYDDLYENCNEEQKLAISKLETY